MIKKHTNKTNSYRLNGSVKNGLNRFVRSVFNLLDSCALMLVFLLLLNQTLAPVALAQTTTPPATPSATIYHLEHTYTQDGTSEATPSATSPAPRSLGEVGPSSAPSLMPSDQSVSSATIRQPIKILPLAKTNFMSTEEITVRVANAKDYQIQTKLIYGKDHYPDLLIEKESNVDFATLRIPPSLVLKPGKYTLEVKDDLGNSDSVSFTWGNLAVNLEKTVYQPQETAKINFTLADDLGKPVCNAKISAEIKLSKEQVAEVESFDKLRIKGGLAPSDSRGETSDGIWNTNYTSENDSIKTDSSSCSYTLEFTVPPQTGVYDLSATAAVDNQTYTSQNTFEVNDRPLSISRKTKSIFNPRDWQQMELEIRADQDFTGILTDTVPDQIDVATPDSSELTAFDQITSESTWYNKGSILGTTIPPLGLPFVDYHNQTLGFGDNIRDPKEARLYSQFGLAGHDGVDYDLAQGTPILAVDSGMIALAEEEAEYGTTVVIQHSWGKSYYGHLSKIEVTLGQRVTKGEQIGLSGNTGLSLGSHLHFGIKPDRNDPKNGYYGKINPLPYLEIPENKVSTTSYTSTALSQVKKISWDLNLKKGETIRLGYQFKTPADPSTAYLLGPISYSVKLETLNSKLETNPNVQNPNVQNSFENSNLENSKIVSNFDIRASNFFSDSYLYQILSEYYEVQGASFDQAPADLEMLTIDPALLAVPDDYPPRKAVLNQKIKGQYADLILTDNPPSFQMNYATTSATPNWIKLTASKSEINNDSGVSAESALPQNDVILASPELSRGTRPESVSNFDIRISNFVSSVDLIYETYDGYLNQKLIVKDDKAEKTFQFELEKSDNLTVEDYSGHLLVKDSQTQEEFFLLRFPQGIDAQNQRIDYKWEIKTEAVNQPTTDNRQPTTVSLTLYPARFWQYEKAVYPITIYAPVNVIAWNEAGVHVGENCPDAGCAKDGDASVYRPTGWYWGKEERRRHLIVKIPKLKETEREEFSSKTEEPPEKNDDGTEPLLSSKKRNRLYSIEGLPRYAIDYTQLATPVQLTKIRDKNKKEFSPILDARNNKSVIKKKTKDQLISSVIPENSRLAYQYLSKFNIFFKKLLKKLMPPVFAQTTVVKTIGSAASRDYSDIQTWENAVNGTLTSIQQGLLFNDSTFTISASILINGSTTSANNYIHLTVAPSERHKGIAGTGVKIDLNQNNIGFSIQDNYTRLEWIELTNKGDPPGNGGAILFIGDSSSNTATDVLIQNVIVHKVNITDWSTSTIKGSDYGYFTIRNSIVYNGDDQGFRHNGTCTPVCTADIQNVTVYGMGGRGIFDNGRIFTVKNTISMGNGGDDMDLGNASSTCDYVMCEDNSPDCDPTTANPNNCTNSLVGQSTSGQFVSTTAGSEDFHLVSTSTAIDKGTNLSANFANDIDDTVRAYGPWDIGADEYPYRLIDSLMRHGKYFGGASGSKQPFTF